MWKNISEKKQQHSQQKIKTMREQLIKFETANLACKNGFDWFDELDNGLGATPPFRNGTNIELCSETTQSRLQKWLRETHGILITPRHNHEKKQYWYYINNTDGLKLNEGTFWFDTYELALEAGLQTALTFIK